MSDTLLVPGGTALLAFDTVTLPDGTTGVLVARQKVGFGVDGVYADVTAAAPLPTTDTGVLAKLTAGVPVTVVGGQLGETLWTDDTGAYFVRLDSGGTVTFYPPTGGAAVTPGTGLRPAGDAAYVDRASYSVTTAATGIAVGDLVDHLLAYDRKTNAIVSNAWLNTTQGTYLASAPAAANIAVLGSGTQPVSLASQPLPAGAATEATLVAQSAKLPASLGAKTSAASLSVAPASDALFNPGLVVPDRASSGLTLDLNTANATTATLFVAGMASLGILLPTGTYGTVVIEAQTTPGDAYEVVSVLVRGATGRLYKSITAAGAYDANIAGLYSVRLRTTVVGGTAGSVAPVLNMTAAQRHITTSPTNTGQTTRSYVYASGVAVSAVTTGSVAAGAGIQANEVRIQVAPGTSGAWVRFGAAADKTSGGSLYYGPGDRDVVQITPGDTPNVLADSASVSVQFIPVA